MVNRTAKITRKTKETEIEVELNLDGSGKSDIKIGVGFLEHMLTLFAARGMFDLKVFANGDLDVDDHHTIEDIGICIGQAFSEAIGDKRGIRRYGFWILPMDETLATIALDLSGRSALVWNVQFEREKIGDMSTEMLYDFFDAFSRNAQVNLHMKIEYGRNEHHRAEALFKGWGMAMRMACEIDPRQIGIPSTKGILSESTDTAKSKVEVKNYDTFSNSK
ncbi:imidazoleglycerol-phosphate dehydratase HisB [Candidatus Micrarchaeota archaeon]|nr:imidazoleglycerol-phosphate dehydratase HisB [Candidatus Micrarchaeota archaeon]